MKVFYYSLLALSLLSCGNPVERMCDIYDNAALDAADASSMEELEDLRASVASDIDGIVFSSGDEIRELLRGKKKDYALINRLKNSENLFVTAVRNRTKAVYPPLSQLLDVYSAGKERVEKATDYETLQKAIQQSTKDIQLVSMDYKLELGRLSNADKASVAAAESEFKSVVAERSKEFSGI